ncbi:hypothetical protein BDQ94DRAFT_151954 [Aspergillus welwitschiae]|uniref:Uncharacterized protein n=1 Tax=Aspergillus welwitschiae TaxID=1341132 RepID=A0A3F3PNK9_9EURO|nr:hypothetical protein BDQ94DRAFT_151954 [Aspergillus welwitschiae]RDH28423.1 hypothetical protein BDQ94DRAFT_151954 [Aspergillus welwitschiae]
MLSEGVSVPLSFFVILITAYISRQTWDWLLIDAWPKVGLHITKMRAGQMSPCVGYSLCDGGYRGPGYL